MALPNKYQQSDNLVLWLSLFHDQVTTDETSLSSQDARITTLEGRQPVNTSPVAVTSGSSVSLATNIPSWVRRVSVILSGVSLSGTDNLLIQFGSSGSLETSGYESYSSNIQDAGNPTVVTSTSGFIIRSAVAADNLRGIYTFFLHNPSTNTWEGNGGLYRIGTPRGVTVSGGKSLSSALTNISILATGANSFDGSGSASVRYEY
jgi:hypothetical protein